MTQPEIIYTLRDASGRSFQALLFENDELWEIDSERLPVRLVGIVTEVIKGSAE